MTNVISFDEVRQRFSKRREGDLEEYFSLPDTPAPGSPVGTLMVKVLEKFPVYTFEQARTKANELLDEAAGKRAFRAPLVETDSEQEARRKAVRARFTRSERPADAA